MHALHTSTHTAATVYLVVRYYSLGRVALVRGVAAYSHQTFPWTICRSVRTCVRRSVCPVHCGKTADRIRMPFGIIGRTCPGMKQVVGFRDWSMEKGTFGGEFGARHCPQASIGRTCSTAPRRGPLVKLLWADLLDHLGIKQRKPCRIILCYLEEFAECNVVKAVRTVEYNTLLRYSLRQVLCRFSLSSSSRSFRCTTKVQV